MAVRSKAWEQVGEKFETLGEHLRKHVDDVGADASAERVAFEKLVRGLLSAMEDGFTTAGKVVRDPVLRDDVAGIATSVREALLSSVEMAGEQVRGRLSLPSRAAKPATRRASGAAKPGDGKPATPAARKSATPAAGKRAPRKRAAS